MEYTFKPKGVCPSKLTFDMDNGIVKNVQFVGGCNGNLKGLGALVENMPAEEVIKKLSGITCGRKSTSCPDQLAQALSQISGA